MNLKLRSAAAVSAAVFLLSGLMPAANSIPASAEDGLLCAEFSGNNVNGYDYTRWASPITSTLLPWGDDGWMRVQGGVRSLSGQLLIEYYYSDFSLADRETLPLSLPVYGGVYRTSDGKYAVISGQTNPDKLDTLPVVDITVYDGEWNVLGSDSIPGDNTVVPFDGGSVRCTDNGKYLFVRTAHEMHSGHQSNITIQFDLDTCKVTDSAYNSYNYTGYASHSFNQFVLLDGNHVVMLDHGDYYPRAIVMRRPTKDISGGNFGSSSTPEVKVLEFPWPSDKDDMTLVNYTGAAVGGFAMSSTHYLIAYNQILDLSQAEAIAAGYSDSNTRNIWVAAVPRDSFTDDSVTRRKLTDYADGEPKGKVPHLVQLGTDSFALLWQQGDNVNCVHIDGTGKQVGSVTVFPGKVSDCEPVLRDGYLCWYTWENSSVTLYRLSAETLDAPEVLPYVGGHEYVLTGDPDENGTVTLHCYKCGSNKQFTVPTAVTLYYHSTLSEDAYYWPMLPKSLDAGMEFSILADIEKPSNPENKDFVVEIVSGGDYITRDNPDSLRSVQDFHIANFDAAQAEAVFRVYPKYNPGIAKEFTLRLAHDIEDGETVLPTAESEGYIEHTCKNCGYSYREILPKLTDLADPDVSVTFAEDADCEFCGSPVKPPLTAVLTNADGAVTELAEGTDFTVEYEDNLNAGTASAVLTAVPGSLHVYGVKTAQFTITPMPLDKVSADIAANLDDDPEKVFAPDLELHGAFGALLEEGRDYTAVLGENVWTVTGAGNYTGTKTVSFEPQRIDLSEYEVSFANETLAAEGTLYYTGKPLKPEVIVKNGSRTLRLLEDYKVSYSDCTAAGRVTVTVTGIGAYCGENSSLSFTILPVDIGNAEEFAAGLADSAPIVFSGEPLTPRIIVNALTEGAPELTEGEDFTVQYEKNLSVGTALVTVTGIGNYTGSLSFAFEILPLDVTETGEMIPAFASVMYTGEDVSPQVTVTVGGKTLTGSYSLDYGDVVSVGKKTITATFFGNYTGTLTAEWEILPAAISEEDLCLDAESFAYTGKAIKPKAERKDKKTWLEGVDYEISYRSNTDAGTGYAMIRGLGNYTGEAELPFTILPLDLSDAGEAVCAKAELEWNGKAQEPEITVSVGGKALDPEKDYTVTYSSNTEPGDALALVQGKGNYTGTLEAAFRIVPAVITEDMFYLVERSIAYFPTGVEPRVHCNTFPDLAEGTDFDVTYTGNTEIGMGKATVTGKKNLTGTAELSFSVIPATVDGNVSLVLDFNEYEYDGRAAYRPGVTAWYLGYQIDSADFSVTYSDNTDAGEATVDVVFGNHYRGTAQTGFTIRPIELKNTTIEVSGEECVYDGSKHRPEVRITLPSGRVLGEENYSVIYSRNTHAGEAEIVIQGKSPNITGSDRILHFTIAPADLRSCQAKVITGEEPFLENGSEICPPAEVKFGKTVLTEGEDYTLSYRDNVAAGTGYAVVEGINDFTGLLTLPFEIAAQTTETTTVTTETEPVTTTTTTETEPVTTTTTTETEPVTTTTTTETEPVTTTTATETEPVTTTTATETEPVTTTETTATEPVTTTTATETEPVTTTEITATEPVTTTTPTETTITTTETETTTATVSETTTTETVSESTTTETVSESTTTETVSESTTTATVSETTTTETVSETTATETESETDPVTGTTMPAEQVLYDFNGDGAFTVADLVLMYRVLTEEASAAEEVLCPFSALDTDGDGVLTLFDAAPLIRALAQG